MVRFGHRWVAVRSIRAPRAAEPLNCLVPAIAFPKVFGRIPPNVGNKIEKASSRDGQQANHDQRRLAKRNLRSAKSPRFIPPYRPRPPTPVTSCCRYVFQSSMCMMLSSWMPGGDVGFQPTSSPDTSAGLFGCDCLRLELDAQRLRDAGTVGRIRLGAVADVPLLDVEFCVAHCTRRVLEQQLLLRRRHLPEQISRLFPMIVVDAVVPVRCFPFERERRLGKIRLVVPEPRAV